MGYPRSALGVDLRHDQDVRGSYLVSLFLILVIRIFEFKKYLQINALLLESAGS